MSEHAIVQPQKTNIPQQITSNAVNFQRQAINHDKTAVLSEWKHDTVSDDFAEPRFGYDFSRVPAHTGMVRQNLPKLRKQSMVQRSPKDGASDSSSCPTCPEAEFEQISGTTEPTAEPAVPTSDVNPTPVSSEPTEVTATPGEVALTGLIVEDSATELAPGQMKKSEFLSQLRVEVCRTVEAAIAGTGRTTDDCPYLNHWFDFYSSKDNMHIERAIHRYAPDASNITTASGYVSVIIQRARQAAETWARTGEITGVPEGVPTTVPGEAPAESGEGATTETSPVMFKAREGGARAADDLQAIQKEMGEGNPIDSGVRSRMESAFGMDFAQVRTHTDTTAAGLSSRLNACAFTVGKHIAFGASEYKPGTLIGDALIAHELAHVVQQSGTNDSVAPMEVRNADYDALEKDADRTAVGAVASLYYGAKGTLADIVQNAMPRLHSGLRLQRCDCSGGCPAPSRTTRTTSAVTFTLQNQTGTSTDPAATAAVVSAGGKDAVQFRGTAAAGYTPEVTISAPDDATARDYEAGLIQNVLTTDRVFTYTPSGTVRTTLPTIPIKDGAPSSSGLYDAVFAENGGGHPGVLEMFTTNGATVNLNLPDTPGDFAFVSLSDEPSCSAPVAVATLARLRIHDTFRTWVGTRNRTSAAVTTHHHIDWETNWEATVAVTGGTATVTHVSRSIDVTEANGDGSPAYISGGSVPADIVTRTCT